MGHPLSAVQNDLTPVLFKGRPWVPIVVLGHKRRETWLNSRTGIGSDDVKPDENGENRNTGTIESRGLLNDEKSSHRVGSSPQGPGDGETLYRHCVDRIASGKITPHQVIGQLGTALTMGLSPENTVKAHILLGNEWTGLDNVIEATRHYDCALEAAQKHRDELAVELLSILYRNISTRYIVLAKRVRTKEGLDNAFVYLESKCGLLNGGASPELYLELGNLYDEKSPFDFDKIASYYTKAMVGAVLDEDDEAALRTARERLRIIEKEQAHLSARKRRPALGLLPWKAHHRKVALTAVLGILALVAGLIGMDYLRSGTFHSHVTEESPGLVGSREVTKYSVTVPPAVRSEIRRASKIARSNHARTPATCPRDGVHPKAHRKTLALNSRWGWPDILP